MPAQALSWAELAAAAADDEKRPEGLDPGLAHELRFDGGDATTRSGRTSPSLTRGRNWIARSYRCTGSSAGTAPPSRI